MEKLEVPGELEALIESTEIGIVTFGNVPKRIAYGSKNGNVFMKPGKDCHEFLLWRCHPLPGSRSDLIFYAERDKEMANFAFRSGDRYVISGGGVIGIPRGGIEFSEISMEDYAIMVRQTRGDLRR